MHRHHPVAFHQGAYDKKDDKPHTLQVCLRYRECPTEEIPVLYDECGCDDTKCAPNRILESYDVDVMIVDSKDEPPTLHTPRLQWDCTVNIAHAARVALHDITDPPRLYILTRDDPGNVYQVSASNHSTITSHNLSAQGLVLAVSNTGERVYVATAPAGAGQVRQLYALDATKPGLPAINANPIDIPNSAGSDVVLVVAPDNRLLALVTATGHVLRWDTDISSNPAPTEVGLFAANQKAFALSKDGSLGYAAGASNELQKLDLTASPPASASKLFDLLTPAIALIVIKSTGDDLLAAVDSSIPPKLHLIAPTTAPVSSHGSVELAHSPIALAASPGGQWAYVLEQDGTSSYVQAVNLHQIQQKLSPVVGKPFEVGDESQQIVVSDSGMHLYIPFTDDMAKHALGGVAVLDVSEQACEEILWRHLHGCPQCDDTSKCVVLATIENYQIGDKIENQTDPPADPATDIAAHIARIDNRNGRQLLPSPQVLLELIECLMQQGPSGAGTQGPPGAPGEQGLKGDTVVGPAGPGLEEGLVRIKALSWKHNGLNKFFPVQMTNDEERLGIVIEFTDLVDVGRIIDTNHVFQLLVEKAPAREGDQAWLESIFRCRCPIAGDIVPVKCGDNGTGLITSAKQITGSVSHGVAFVLDENTRVMVLKALESDLIRPDFSVILRGDFVLDMNGRAVDAEFVRAELPTGDRPKGSLFGIQGGTFESWFTVREEG